MVVATSGWSAGALAALARTASPERVQPVDWAALSPVLLPAAAVLVVLLVQAVRPARRDVLDAVALGGLLGAALALALTGRTARGTFCLELPDAPAVGAGPDLAGACSYVTGPLTTGLQAVVLAAAVVALLLAVDGPGARARAEHHALLLAATAGAMVLAGARDLPTLLVAVETASLPVVALVALRRDATGAQAAVKLLLVAVVSLGLLVLGTGLVYAGTGTVHLAATAGTSPEHPTLAVLGAALLVAGLAYKLSAAPFGWWTPDVYAGSPVPVAAFLSTVSKVAGLAALVVVVAVGLPWALDDWGPLLGVLAVASMTVGNLVALTQRTAVRLLAWSTVAQAGWVVLPLAGAGAGVLTAVEASVGYLLAYVVASLAAFTVVVLVTRHHRDGSGHGLAAYRGLLRTEPVAAAALALALLCLAGLPPGVMGVVAKVVALRPVVDDDLWWLAGAAAVNVALGAAYYLRWTALLVLPAGAATDGSPPGARSAERLDAHGGAGRGPRGPGVVDEAHADGAATWDVTPAEGLALGLSSGACLVLSVVPQLVAGPLGG
ncbi:NADH-quinone oxidoreductase subunit N [Thalassiella azotivora]